MSRVLQVVAVGIMFAGPSLGARLKLDEKRLAPNDRNPFADMMGMMGENFPGGIDFPGDIGFPGIGGNRAPASDFIAPMGDLSTGAAPEFPIVAECFSADESMGVQILPMVMQGKISYDGKGKRVRTDFEQFGKKVGYEIALESLNCKLKVDLHGKSEIEKLDGQFPNFQLIPGATYKGTQKVDGVECYRYHFKLVVDIDIWVSAAEPHVPVYMSFTAPMVGTIHHHLKNHHIIDDCNFDDSLFDAPQCIPTTKTVVNEVFGSVSGNPIIFVIDESGSMDQNTTGRSRRTVCREELETVLKSFSETTKINVIPFSGSAQAVFSSPVPATSENVNQAMAKVRAFSGGGSTNSEAALELAYRMQTSSEDDPQIYFLSDGEPDQSAESILSNILGWDNRRNIKVNTIVVGGDGRDFMMGLATKTGGTFKEIDV